MQNYRKFGIFASAESDCNSNLIDEMIGVIKEIKEIDRNTENKINFSCELW